MAAFDPLSYFVVSLLFLRFPLGLENLSLTQSKTARSYSCDRQALLKVERQCWISFQKTRGRGDRKENAEISSRFLTWEFQWFFMAFSLRPGKSLEISTHLFPNFSWAARRVASSSSVHGPLTISFRRWFIYRSLHCFPLLSRNERDFAILAQLLTPYCVTRARSFLSSIWFPQRKKSTQTKRKLNTTTLKGWIACICMLNSQISCLYLGPLASR